MENIVGYRFHPTDEELINHYLKNKILGNTWLINEVNEININDYEPECLPSLSKIPPNDPTWYFFAPTLYVNPKKILRKRSTRCGYWKSTGKYREIKDKSGNKIGEKKTLVYRLGKHLDGEETPWVMHEYLIKCWSHPDPESYVICKIKYKGEFYQNTLTLFNINNNHNVELGTAYVAQDDNDDKFVSELEHVDREAAKRFLSDEQFMSEMSYFPQIEQPVEEENGLSLNDLEILVIEQDEYFDPNTFLDCLNENNLEMPIMNEQNDPNMFLNGLSEKDLPMTMNEPPQAPYVAKNNDMIFDENTLFNDQELEMQENCNDYKPRKPLSGIIVDYDSDTDSEAAKSIFVTSYQGTLSPGDSVGSSLNEHFPSCRDEILSSSTGSGKDLQTSSADSSVSRENTESQLTRRITPSNQEVKEEDLVKTEKKEKGLFVTEKAMEKTNKNPQYIYPMKMIIIGLILLLVLIVSVLSSTAKT